MATREGNDIHRVTLCRHASKETRGQRPDGSGDGGGRRKLWAFSWEDLATLFGVPAKTVQSWTRPRYVGKKTADRRNLRGPLFDPTSLESIVKLYNARESYRKGLR